MTTRYGFPFYPTPTIGDKQVTATKTYTWNGIVWRIETASNTATSIVSPELQVTSSTVSLSTITGALTVVGGVGIGGDLHIGGLIYSNGVPALTTASFNLSSGPDGGVDIGIDVTATDPISGLHTITINNQSTLETVTGRGSSSTHIIRLTNNTTSTDIYTGALVVAGGVGIAGRVNTESIQIADTVFDSTESFSSTFSPSVIDSYHLSAYRSSKYFIQISEPNIDQGGYESRFHAVEIVLTAKNDGTPYMTQYGQVTTGGELGTFSAESSGTAPDIVISLIFTPNPAGPREHGSLKTIKVLRTAMVA